MLLKLIKKEGFDTRGGGDEGDKGGLGWHSTQQKVKKTKYTLKHGTKLWGKDSCLQLNFSSS